MLNCWHSSPLLLCHVDKTKILTPTALIPPSTAVLQWYFSLYFSLICTRLLRTLSSEHLFSCMRISIFRSEIGIVFTTTVVNSRWNKIKAKKRFVTITLKKQILNIMSYKDLQIIFVFVGKGLPFIKKM